MRNMNKKIVRIFLVLIMVFALADGVVVQSNAVSAKSIYFAGFYNKKTKDGKKTLTMNQYSSPEDKKVGNFSLEEFVYNEYTGYYNLWESTKGTLKKIGKNKYRCKKGKITFTFTVYKKKVVVKQNRKGSLSTNFTGTYKLKKRYYS